MSIAHWDRLMTLIRISNFPYLHDFKWPDLGVYLDIPNGFNFRGTIFLANPMAGGLIPNLWHTIVFFAHQFTCSMSSPHAEIGF